MSEFLVVGEALVDVVVSLDGARTEHPGGSPANVALGLGRLGKDVSLLTWLAGDPQGRMVTEHLEASGVVVLPGSLGAQRTPVALARVDASGTATYEFDLSWDLAPLTLAGDVAVVHTGSIGAVAATRPADALKALLRHARSTAIVTYDPNLRPSIMGAAGEVRGKVEALVGLADVVKVSDEDLGWLYPDADRLDVAHRWVAEHGCAFVVVTLGGHGSVAVLADGTRVEVPAPAVTVADTVGAGDSYMGGLLATLSDRGLTGASSRDVLRAVDALTVTSMMERAARVAAITVSRPGANPPTAAELARASDGTAVGAP